MFSVQYELNKHHCCVNVSPPLLGAIFTSRLCLKGLIVGRCVWICFPLRSTVFMLYCQQVMCFNGETSKVVFSLLYCGKSGGGVGMGVGCFRTTANGEKKEKNFALLTTPAQKVNCRHFQKPLCSFHLNLHEPHSKKWAHFDFHWELSWFGTTDVSVCCLSHSREIKHEQLPTWKLPYRLFLIPRWVPVWLLLRIIGDM